MIKQENDELFPENDGIDHGENSSFSESLQEEQESEKDPQIKAGEAPDEDAKTADQENGEAFDGEENLVSDDVSVEMTEGSDKKKGLFKKKEKKDKTKEQIEELTDRLKRQMAEFDNFRKRTEKEKAQMYEIGAKSVVEKILPVVDNFERGLQAAQQGGEENSFIEGMDKIYKQLLTELANIGVVPIEALGQEFNPDFHNAVMQVESGEFESGVVAQELLKGYMYRESVVRHSMVAVVE